MLLTCRLFSIVIAGRSYSFFKRLNGKLPYPGRDQLMDLLRRKFSFIVLSFVVCRNPFAGNACPPGSPESCSFEGLLHVQS